MNLTTEHTNGLAIVRVGETRLMYPMLADFSARWSALIAKGEKKLLIDLSPRDLRRQRDDRLLHGPLPAGAAAGGRR